MMVDDDEEDLEAGRGAGCMTVGIGVVGDFTVTSIRGPAGDRLAPEAELARSGGLTPAAGRDIVGRFLQLGPGSGPDANPCL